MLHHNDAGIAEVAAEWATPRMVRKFKSPKLFPTVSDDDVSDAIQDGLVVLLERYRDKPTAELPAILSKIVFRRLCRTKKQAKKTAPLDAPIAQNAAVEEPIQAGLAIADESHSPLDEQVYAKRAVQKLFATATPRQQEIMEALYQGGTHEDVAHELGIARSSVSVQLLRIRADAACLA
ncbi:MAG: sigma-70 family RNA polymerase sigma factor [Burkholderiales bacterium]|nr:sigma-70 family RNA polymerase sigma factor [Burkholderiales bacterium]